MNKSADNTRTFYAESQPTKHSQDAPPGNIDHSPQTEPDLAKANKQLRKLLARRRKAQEKAGEQMYELSTANQQLKCRIEQSRNAEQALEAEVRKLTENNRDLQKQLRQNKKLQKKLQTEYTELIALNEQLYRQSDEHRREGEDLQEQYARLEQLIRDHGADLEEAGRRIALYRQKFGEIKDTPRCLAEGNTKSDRTDDSLQQQLDRYERAKETLITQAQELEQTNEQLRRQSHEHRRIAEQFRRQNEKLSMQNHALRVLTAELKKEKQHLQKNTANSGKGEEHLQLLNDELTAAQDRLETSTRTYKQTENELRQQIAELTSANEQLQVQAAEYKDIERLQREYTNQHDNAVAELLPADQPQYRQPKDQRKIADLIAWPALESAHSGAQAAEPQQSQNNIEIDEQWHAVSDEIQFQLKRRHRNTILAAAAVIMLVVSLGIFKVVFLPRPGGTTAWGPIPPLSLSGTTTQSAGLVTGIVFNRDMSTAVVGDQLVHEGDVIRGVKIAKIHKDRIEFEKDGEKWDQRLFETPPVDWETTVPSPDSPSEKKI